MAKHDPLEGAYNAQSPVLQQSLGTVAIAHEIANLSLVFEKGFQDLVGVLDRFTDAIDKQSK